MQKIIIIFSVLAMLLLREECHGQSGSNRYTAGINYTVGIPTFVPQGNVSKVAIDTGTMKWYEYATPGGWRWSGDRVQDISGCAAPAYTPGKAQSRLVLNACTEAQNGHGPELYKYTGSAWLCLNCGGNYTAGDGIDITGAEITNTAPDQVVGIAGAGINAVTGTYPNFTVTGTEVDGSVTNELQTLSVAGNNLTISDGNTVTLPTPSSTLDALTDVTITSPTNAQILQYNTATTQWVNATLSAITGSGTTNHIPKFSASGSITNSQIQDDVNVSINGAVQGTYKLAIYSSNGNVMRFTNTGAGTFSDFLIGTNAFSIGSNLQFLVAHAAPASAFSVESNRIVTSLTELRSSTGDFFIRPTTGGVSGRYISIDGFNGGWVQGFKVANTGSGGSAIIAQIVPGAGIAAIGTASPNVASKLDVTSTTGGILFPRMTGTQRDAIASPPDGLVVYNTTASKLQVRAASAWVDLH